MKQTRIMMDMPITIEIVDATATNEIIDQVYEYFTYIDTTFSPFKENSEVSRINRGILGKEEYSSDMKIILALAEQTKQETQGFFDVHQNGKLDPSGIVKGWAINNAAKIVEQAGFSSYYVDAGGDIQVLGTNREGNPWKIGIRHPFEKDKIVKTLAVTNHGIATSGTYLRGQHIYNPKNPKQKITGIVSLTVIGPNIYEADRFATAAFAMERQGIQFIEQLSGFEGYMIDKEGKATYTSGFEKYVI